MQSSWLHSFSSARPFQATHLSFYCVPGILYVTIPPTFLGGVAWWHLYEADLKLYKIYSMTLLQRQTITMSAAHVGQLAERRATCGTSSSLPLSRCTPGSVSPWLSIGWARPQSVEEGVEQLAVQELMRERLSVVFWSGFELAKWLCDLYLPISSTEYKGCSGFSEASFSWPRFGVSPLGLFCVSNTYLAGHIQVISASDYQWLCCPLRKMLCNT